MSNEFTLWMGEIKPWMTEIFIQNSFNHFGFYPKSIKVIKEKKYYIPLNYCFIYFDSFYQANQALNKLNGIKIPNVNFKFKLKWANKNFENIKTVNVANIPLEVKRSELYNFFKKKYQSVIHAIIIRENQAKKNYGFVYIANDDEYNKCLLEMNEACFFNSIIEVKERNKKISEEKKCNLGVNININEIKSYCPNKKENENSESIETNSTSEEETKKISRKKFLDNLYILESNDHSLINENIQKSVNKMFNYYKNSSEISSMILYYGTNINNYNVNK